MILHPGILALLCGALLSLALVGRATYHALGILRHWQAGASSARQLQLERDGDLVTTLVRCALVFEVVALLLFLYSVDDLHGLFTGAMCATGTLNLDRSGWLALGARLLVCFAAAFWLAIDRLDRDVPEAPLMLLKCRLLLGLAPLLLVTALLQLRFFLALRPDVITSCCGALFDNGRGVAAELAALPLRPTLFAGVALLAVCVLAAGQALRSAAAWPRHLLALGSALLLPVAVAVLVSVVSPYVYALPSHHCPFDMLQRAYRFIGYPLYLSLFGAVHYGLLPGLCRPLRRHAALGAELPRRERHWLRRALLAQLLLAGLIAWSIITSPLALFGVG